MTVGPGCVNAQPDPQRLAGAKRGLIQAEGDGDRGELDGADVTGGHPQLAELVGRRTRRRIARIDGLAGGEQREIALPGRAVVGEVTQAGVAGPIARRPRDVTTGGIPEQVMAERRDLTGTGPRKRDTIRAGPRRGHGVLGEDRVPQDRVARRGRSPPPAMLIPPP